MTSKEKRTRVLELLSDGDYITEQAIVFLIPELKDYDQVRELMLDLMDEGLAKGHIVWYTTQFNGSEAMVNTRVYSRPLPCYMVR